MAMRLEELGAVIESGSVISRIQAADSIEDKLKVKVIVPKALAGEINEEQLDEIHVDAKLYDSGKIKTTSANDVVMKLTSPYDVGYVHEEQTGLVVSSYCVVIRLKDNSKLDGKFLTYLLNSPYAKDYFRSVTSGASTVMIKVKDIAGLPIPEIPMEEQVRLGEIFEAFSRKKVLLSQMIEAENAAENSLIMEAIEGRL